jgi:hypothetical protein
MALIIKTNFASLSQYKFNSFMEKKTESSYAVKFCIEF